MKPDPPPRCAWAPAQPLFGPLLTGTALLLLAAVTVLPLLLERRPAGFVPPYPSASTTRAVEMLVLGGMALVIVFRAWLDRYVEPAAPAFSLLFIVLAQAMTALHWVIVDRDPLRALWQRDLYLGLLNGTYSAPHQYRPLPYGVARLLERLTGDWKFACLAYRWFFTYWFLWASFRFARLFHRPGPALGTLAPLVLLYPLSILHYNGQLTDPLSHALFVLALVYLVEDRIFPLATALALGVLAKETALLVVPVYLACHRRQGWRVLLITAALAVVGVLAFLAPRSLNWQPGYQAINGTVGLMAGTNLGIGTPIARTNVPLSENYLHPLLFVGLFIPALVWQWRRLDPLLRTLVLTLTALILVSNLCFGWLYESRNYMPLLPVLTTAALRAKPARHLRCGLPPAKPAPQVASELGSRSALQRERHKRGT